MLAAIGELAGELSSDFWSAMAGAVLGGAISWGLQSRQHQNEADRQDRALAAALIVKLYRMHMNLHGLRLHVERAAAEAKAVGQTLNNMTLRFIPNLPSNIDLTTEEMGLLLRRLETDLYLRVVMVEADHSGFLDLFRTYVRRREDLEDRMPAPSRVEAGVLHFSAEDLAATALQRANLDSLAELIHREAVVVDDRGLAVLRDVKAALSALLPEKLVLTASDESKARY